MLHRAGLSLIFACSIACQPQLSDVTADVASDGGPGEPHDPYDSGIVAPPDAGAAAVTTWEERVEPTLRARCAPCHVGQRFAFASLEEDTRRNYETFLDQISLDAPSRSRLLEKALGHMPHAGGAVLEEGEDAVRILHDWIDEERAARCADCGQGGFVAYVEQPRIFWALDADPVRSDVGVRDRARIMMRPLDGGAPFAFLPDDFCGVDGRCDFGNIATNHRGDQIAFECRMSTSADQDWVNDVRWNLCIADIGADGRARNPRFLFSEQHVGQTFARSDPLGLVDDTGPRKGVYDLHFHVRRRGDFNPVFTPDDRRVVFARRGVDPRSGVESFQTYHGYEVLDHIVSASVDGDDLRTIYTNEGGVADQPLFLRNGNIVFHTWNLERMDRHMYTQARADGRVELPVFLGRTQGPNMWGKAAQLANGAIIGETGRRRSSIEKYVLFVGDHTLGAGLEPELGGLRILDEDAFAQILDFPTGYCTQPPDGPSCFVDRFTADPAYFPDGRALVAHSESRVYAMRGSEMFFNYSSGETLEERLASLAPFLPNGLGIFLVDDRGTFEELVAAPEGKMLRYPAYVGRRQPERIQEDTVDGSVDWAELHIADVPLWLAMQRPEQRLATLPFLDSITSLRVLVKLAEDNACLNDNRMYRFSTTVQAGQDHPTHLGINNATGYARLGDVPLESDRSVRVRVPAGELLLFQGVDDEGGVVWQRSRVIALPPGTTSDASVKRAQYGAQCAACHGALEGEFAGLRGVAATNHVPMDFETLARERPAHDLSHAAREKLTFLHAVRPLLDAHCVSCHSGAAPAGDLNLASSYSSTANYPAGSWVARADPAYLEFVPPDARVPGYDWSPSIAWVMRQDEAEYRLDDRYAPLINAHAPLAELTPWDPAYQSLFAAEGDRFRYLGGFLNPNFGRSDVVGGLSRDAWLLEVLTGVDFDPTRDPPAFDHTSLLTGDEVRRVRAVLDIGFPYAASCVDRTVASGPNAGAPYGDPTALPLPR